MAAEPSAPVVEDLLGGIDTKHVEENNAQRYKIAYVTAGDRKDPCVVVPPGAGSTKEETSFWARELASIGPFFAVMFDLRGTGASEPRDRWAAAFAGTTSVKEMERVVGVRPRPKSESESRAEREADDHRQAGGLRTYAQKNCPESLAPAISNALHDFDAYAEDAFTVLDELGIRQAHFVGLSQGGVLARIAATLHPERVLSVVSCGSAASKLGMMMAAFSAGAEEFYDALKAARLYDEDGKPPWASGSDGSNARRATREEYVPWRSKLLEIILPGFERAVYEEMAARTWETGYMDEGECAIAALAYEAWERQGKDKRHLEMLRRNRSIPIMYVHGKKDPVIHFGESQKLFAQTGNCVIEAHEFGHNFGPPEHQTALLGRMARFMRSSVKTGGSAASSAASPAPAPSVGTDTFDAGVSAELPSKLSHDATISELWDAFCTVQTAADTSYALGVLLERLRLTQLNGQGLALFLALKPILESSGLKFSQLKLLKDLSAAMLRANKVVAKLRGVAKPDDAAGRSAAEATVAQSANGGFSEILICGGGPVGLRAACELALLGFRVTVIEKRPNFSRANILTFWDETMSDMLALGAKSYFPSLRPTGNQKVLGTRQIQVCLLKTLLLFGGTVRYGMEICGLKPPSASSSKWQASFRPYVKQRRAAETDALAKRCAEEEGAQAAIEFQQAKDYGGKEMASVETWDVDHEYVDGRATAAETRSVDALAFDAYVIAEGGWSDSTRKLGFSKSVEIFKPVFGLVVNLAYVGVASNRRCERVMMPTCTARDTCTALGIPRDRYNPSDLKEKNMTSKIHFVLDNDWPLRNCPIQAEFVEYLKGETHFFALVVSKKNLHKDTTDAHLERMTPESRAAIPDEMVAAMRLQSQQKGLVEMGVFRRSYASGLACLTTENVDTERLTQMARDITQDMGLPPSTPFFETNPVQLFDFSRRARCIDPVRVLCGGGGCGGTSVLAPADFLQGEPYGAPQALVLPVGDALQEPVWTQGLGINRGFHTAMNQAYACLLARETSLTAAVRESCKVHDAVGRMAWGAGHSGLAGSGSGSIGLRPFKGWNTDPRSRLPIH